MGKHHSGILKRIAAVMLISCLMLFGLTACIGNIVKHNKDENALIQGTWEIDTGSGAGWKFEDDKFWWVKSVHDFEDNYWYGDVKVYSGAQAMKIAALTKGEVKNSLSGIDAENILVLKLNPEKIITDGEDKTATNMNDKTMWTQLWIIEKTDDGVTVSVVDLNTFKMDTYTKID